MCQHISLEVTRQDDDIQVHYLLHNNSHADIREQNWITDNFQANEHCPIEVIPTTDLLNPDTWELQFDDKNRTGGTRWWKKKSGTGSGN